MKNHDIRHIAMAIALMAGPVTSSANSSHVCEKLRECYDKLSEIELKCQQWTEREHHNEYWDCMERRRYIRDRCRQLQDACVVERNAEKRKAQAESTGNPVKKETPGG